MLFFRQNIEISFADALETLVSESYVSNEIVNNTYDIKGFINENIDYQFDINKYKKGVRFQMHELKTMAKDIIKNKHKNHKIEQQNIFKMDKNRKESQVL